MGKYYKMLRDIKENLNKWNIFVLLILKRYYFSWIYILHEIPIDFPF